MTLSSALTNAGSGLAAMSQRAEITAKNVANATTEGYAAQTVELSSVSANGAGSGVTIAGVIVESNPKATNDRRAAQAEYAGQGVIAENMKALENLVGGVDDSGSLFNLYANFETALRNLADAPEQSANQYDVFYAAQDIVETYNDAQADLLALREDIDAEIGREVDRLNAALTELNDLNRDIVRDQDNPDLISAQREVLNDIADIVEIRTQRDDDGQVRVFAVGDTGQTELTRKTLTFYPSPVYQAGEVYDNTDVEGVTGPGGIRIGNVDATPGPTNQHVSYSGLNSGRLAALFEVRDQYAVEMQTQLDALANDLVVRFEDSTVETGNAPGLPGIFTNGGLDSEDPIVPGLAGRLSINPRVDPNAAGGELYRLREGMHATAESANIADNSHVLRLLDAFTSVNDAPTGSDVAGKASSTDLIASYTSLRSTLTVSAESSQAMRAARFDTLAQEEARLLGVDLDTELQDLTTIQQAYQANAQVLQVIDELMQILLLRR